MMRSEEREDVRYFGVSRHLSHGELEKRYAGSWVWRTVAAMIDVEGVDPSPRWMAENLHVSVEEVLEALDGLQALGIVRRTPEGYQRVLKYVLFSDRQLDPKALLADHALITTQILGRMKPRPHADGGFYRSGFVATQKETYQKFCQKLETLMKEFLLESSETPPDRVVGFCFSGVRVDAPFKEEKG